MSASFVSSTGCDVINPAGFVQQNYIHRTHHCLRFLNLTLYCRSWPECILWIRSVLGQQSGDTLFKVVRSPGQKGINPIHQALDTKLINHSALFYHRRETTPETNGLRLIQLFTFPRWSRKKKLIKLSFKQLEQRAHKCLFNQRSTSGSVYREDASCVVSLYMNCFRRYESFIFMWALVLKRTFLVREQKKKTSQEILKASKSRKQKRQESESWNSSVVYFYFISDELGLVVNHLESHCRVAMKHLDFMWHISCWSSKRRN